MKTRSMAEIIAEQPFFRGFDASFVELFAGCASNVHFRENEFLLREGEDSNQFFIIREGTAAVEIYAGNKGVIKIQTLNAGELVGWSWLLPPHKSQFDVRAVTDTAVIAFDADCLRKKCATDYKFGYEMLTRIAQMIIERLQYTRMQLIDIYG